MIYLYSCSGSADHGCEAAARAAKQLLGCPMRLYSQHVEEEYLYKMHELMDIGEDKDDDSPRKGRRFTVARMQTKFRNPEDKEMFFRKQEMLSTAKPGDIWLCMDEEAYCRAEEETDIAVKESDNAAESTTSKVRKKNSQSRVFISGEELHNLLKGVPVSPESAGATDVLPAAYSVASGQRAMRSVLSARGAKTVLWNCAADAGLTGSPEVTEDLKSYDLIVASESITYEAVRRIHTNVLLSADPAFLLPPAYLPLPEDWKEGRMVGLQISSAHVTEPSALQAICGLIEEILSQTEYSLALLPFSVREDADDRTILEQLYEQYADTGRVVLIGDCNCMELKGYIVRCRIFIGMHTQAAIAAWSGGVPALILSDAIKANGIARDLFGEEAHYVLPQALLSDVAVKERLSAAFEWILLREEDIRTHLLGRLPEYCKKISHAKKAVEELSSGDM